MSPAPGGDLRVEAGAIQVLRLYDVAYAIDLPKLEALVAAREPDAVSRSRLARAEPKSLAFGVPPVEIGPWPVQVAVDGAIRQAEAIARVYEFGVVSVAIRLGVAEIAWSDFVTLSNAVERVTSSAGSAELWADLRRRVLAYAAPALDRPSEVDLEEDYHLTIVRRFDRPVTAAELRERVDLAPLLSGEARPLAPSARGDLLRHTFSYYPDDLAVVTWDRAFLLEPSGELDVADIIEVANAQLLELRYYDELLDAELPRMYDRVEEARQLRRLSRHRYNDLATELYTLVADITEITEKVDNALRVTEDVYLARIYGAALEIFRVRTWSAAVDRKLAIIRDTYASLYDQAATARAEILEAMIVILIVLEIVLAFVL